jgi:ATP-dependent Clp protease protease subunit
MLQDRIVLLGTPIDDTVATYIIACLLFLEAQSKATPISLYINSPGGSVTAGVAILDTMRSLKPPVHTVCIGQANSMAAIILTAGVHGNRIALTNATIGFSEVTASGPMTPEKLDHLNKLQTILTDTVVQNTNMTTEQVHQFFSSGRLIPPTEARALGIIDTIATRR